MLTLRRAADCDDGQFCNGAETCSVGVCQAGTPPVVVDPRERCVVCHGEEGEDHEGLEEVHEEPGDKGLDCGWCHAQANLQQDDNPMLPKDDPWRAAARGQGGFSACSHCHYGVSAEGVFGDTFESGDMSEWSGTMPPSGSLTAGFSTTDDDDDHEHEGTRNVHEKHLPEQAQWCYTCHDLSDVPDAPMMVWGASACQVCHDDERYEDSYPFDIHERHAEESIKCYTCHATQPPLFNWPWD